MLAATYARSIGRVVAFSLAAFRQAFAGGRALSSDDAVVIAGVAAARCTRRRSSPAARTRGTRAALARRDGARGAQRGVTRRPGRLGAGRGRRRGRVFEGRGRPGARGRGLRGARVMRAKAAYELTVTRTGRAPGRLAAPDRVDHIEVVSLDDLEVVLFWDVHGARHRPDGGARCAPTSSAWRPTSSSPAGRPWRPRTRSSRPLVAAAGEE